MKTIFIAIALAFITGTTMSEDKIIGSADVVVRKFEVPMPHDESIREKYLWDNFANKPEEMAFMSYFSDDWEKEYNIFTEALVKKALVSKLDANHLKKILVLIRNSPRGKGVRLPVGAYQTMLDDKQIWIVVMKWELKSKSGLGHIAIFAYDNKDLKEVAFVTCR